MNTHNIGFNEYLTKIIFHLSSNTHLISSSWLVYVPNDDLVLTLTFFTTRPTLGPFTFISKNYAF